MHSLRFSLYLIITLTTTFSPLYSIEKAPINIDSSSIQSKIAKTLHVLKNRYDTQIKKLKNYVQPYQKDFKKINKWMHILFGATFYPIVKTVIVAHECGHAAVAQLAGYELKELYISPNPDGGGYVVTTTPHNTFINICQLATGPLAGLMASLTWLKIFNILQDCTGKRYLSLLDAIREPLLSANTSLLGFFLTSTLAFNEFYGNLVPHEVECADLYGDDLNGQTLKNDGKQIETTLNNIAPAIGKYYPHFTYALCGAFICYMIYAENTIIAAKNHT